MFMKSGLCGINLALQCTAIGSVQIVSIKSSVREIIMKIIARTRSVKLLNLGSSALTNANI